MAVGVEGVEEGVGVGGGRGGVEVEVVGGEGGRGDLLKGPFSILIHKVPGWIDVLPTSQKIFPNLRQCRS